MLFPYKNGVGMTARDEEGLLISRRFIEEPSQLLSGFAGVHAVHIDNRMLFEARRSKRLEKLDQGAFVGVAQPWLAHAGLLARLQEIRSEVMAAIHNQVRALA